MYAPKQLALGLALLLIALFCARNHYRRWHDHFEDELDDYIEQYRRGNVLSVTFIAFLFALGGALVYAACIPGGEILITTSLPFMHVTTKGALHLPSGG